MFKKEFNYSNEDIRIIIESVLEHRAQLLNYGEIMDGNPLIGMYFMAVDGNIAEILTEEMDYIAVSLLANILIERNVSLLDFCRELKNALLNYEFSDQESQEFMRNFTVYHDKKIEEYAALLVSRLPIFNEFENVKNADVSFDAKISNIFKKQLISSEKRIKKYLDRA